MTVRVWVAPLDDVNLEGARDVLGSAELERAERITAPVVRRRFLARRLMARKVLAAASGQRPGELVLERGCERCGRPHPASPIGSGAAAIWWSASSSGGLAALAVASRRVGVDLEEEDRRRAGWERIARRFYTEAEWRAVLESPARFLEFWTLKEAYLKALGVGLTGGLDSLDCSALSETVPGWSSNAEHPGWRFGRVRPRAGFTAAVAVEGTPDSIELRHWDPNTEETG